MSPSPRPVHLEAHPPERGPAGSAATDLLTQTAERAYADRGDPLAAGALARALGDRLPTPGAGRTQELWATLATLGAADLTVARVVEPHLDALAILEQAGGAEPEELDRLWGVYAAEGPPPCLEARPTPEGWLLSGRKHWCSLPAVVDSALVTAWVDDSRRQLFAVDLRAPGIKPVAEQDWVARGLAGVSSTGLDLVDVPGYPVGEPDWYLVRPGFAWGGLGVAAIWYGATVAVARRMAAQAQRRALDQVGQMHLGAVDAALHRARCVLADAAAQVDGGHAAGSAGAHLALRVRQVVRDAAEEVLRRADHALGPGPLATEEEHAARVADLHLYLRQEHAERDQAALGRSLLDAYLDPEHDGPFEGLW